MPRRYRDTKPTGYMWKGTIRFREYVEVINPNPVAASGEDPTLPVGRHALNHTRVELAVEERLWKGVTRQWASLAKLELWLRYAKVRTRYERVYRHMDRIRKHSAMARLFVPATVPTSYVGLLYQAPNADRGIAANEYFLSRGRDITASLKVTETIRTRHYAQSEVEPRFIRSKGTGGYIFLFNGHGIGPDFGHTDVDTYDTLLPLRGRIGIDWGSRSVPPEEAIDYYRLTTPLDDPKHRVLDENGHMAGSFSVDCAHPLGRGLLHGRYRGRVVWDLRRMPIPKDEGSGGAGRDGDGEEEEDDPCWQERAKVAHAEDRILNAYAEMVEIHRELGEFQPQLDETMRGLEAMRPYFDLALGLAGVSDLSIQLLKMAISNRALKTAGWADDVPASLQNMVKALCSLQKLMQDPEKWVKSQGKSAVVGEIIDQLPAAWQEGMKTHVGNPLAFAAYLDRLMVIRAYLDGDLEKMQSYINKNLWAAGSDYLLAKANAYVRQAHRLSLLRKRLVPRISRFAWLKYEIDAAAADLAFWRQKLEECEKAHNTSTK